MNLFPPPDKNGQIKFIAGKSLPYKTRMWLVAVLLPAGFGLQAALSFWPGFVLLLAASLLGMVKGYDARRKIVSGLKWERVTPDEYAKIKLRAGQLVRWDEDLFDITSRKGKLAFAVVFVLGLAAYLALAARYGFHEGSGILIGFDAVVLLAPLWLTGIREYLRKDKLVIKIDLLKSVMELLTVSSEAQVFPMLALAKTEKGGTEPEDARLLVKLVGAPDAFYGMQVQVSVNTVQGKDYPYLYCVLIAKEGSGLFKDHERFVPKSAVSPAFSIFKTLSAGLGFSGRKLVYEEQKNPDSDILVVRQGTGTKFGYYTEPREAGAIVTASLELAKKLAAANSTPIPSAACR